MAANFERLAIAERARRAVGEVIHTHNRANETANSLRVRRGPEPFVQSPAFIRLEVAESDPAQPCRIDDGRNPFQCDGEHLLEPRVHQEWLVIFYEELVELNAIRGMKRGYSINVRRDFSHFAIHTFSLLLLFALPVSNLPSRVFITNRTA